mmetsp:Transcript_10683/g.33145  ORF Transcript_10683/g.33145 Transcript_10683/m.33145 type:complete len:381 (+) Transcript_10683:731-1873(+)
MLYVRFTVKTKSEYRSKMTVTSRRLSWLRMTEHCGASKQKWSRSNSMSFRHKSLVSDNTYVSPPLTTSIVPAKVADPATEISPGSGSTLMMYVLFRGATPEAIEPLPKVRMIVSRCRMSNAGEGRNAIVAVVRSGFRVTAASARYVPSWVTTPNVDVAVGELNRDRRSLATPAGVWKISFSKVTVNAKLPLMMSASRIVMFGKMDANMRPCSAVITMLVARLIGCSPELVAVEPMTILTISVAAASYVALAGIVSVAVVWFTAFHRSSVPRRIDARNPRWFGSAGVTSNGGTLVDSVCPVSSLNVSPMSCSVTVYEFTRMSASVMLGNCAMIVPGVVRIAICMYAGSKLLPKNLAPLQYSSEHISSLGTTKLMKLSSLIS